MQNSILPSDVIGQTSEKIFLRDSAKGHIIYCSILLSVIVILILLPLLKVTISIQSPGIIRPVTEKIHVGLMVSGTVTDILVSENQTVNKGDIILKLDDSITKEKLRVLQYKIEEKTKFAHDLQLMRDLWKTPEILIPRLYTLHYKNEYIYFSNQITDIEQQHQKAEKEKLRYQMLHKEKLASLSELEYKVLTHSQLKIQYDMLVQRQLEMWNKNLLSIDLEQKELSVQKEQTKRELDFYAVKAPMGGTIQQFTGIVPGSFLKSSTSIAVISPDTDLIAEILVSPANIGLLKIGTRTRLQIDAFDHNQWGLISGSVKEISNDFILLNDTPVFRIKSDLKQMYLQLKNGRKGFLKKGMTIRARFLITRVSLFQLLYQNLNDWLNPFVK